MSDAERMRAALTEIAELELEGDASLADAMHIADEALNPPPLAGDSEFRAKDVSHDIAHV